MDKKNIEDIMALTPLQEGLLYHYLKLPESEYYFEQLNLVISGDIDLALFKQAWSVVVETNEMLRTVFRWEDIKKPVQMVLRHCPPRIQFLEYPHARGMEKEDEHEEEKRKNHWIEDLKLNDRNKKFDLQQVPFRVTLGKLEKDRYVMIISNYHILYDGWSNGIILREFFDAYNALSKGDDFFQPPDKPKFKVYVKWIKERDTYKQKEYWTDYLKGIETGSRFPTKKKSNKGNSIESFQDTDLVLYHTAFPHRTTTELEEFVKKYKVTSAALLYTAWGILLQKYTDHDDVLFGTTVSGRSAKINNIENMVGLFINTPPLRVTTHEHSFDGGGKIIHLLHHIKETLRQREIHECTPLVNIKDYSRIPIDEELFNSIVVIENYPLDRGVTMKNSHLSLQSYSFVGTPEYDLAIGFLMADVIEVTIGYRAEAIAAHTITSLRNHLRHIIDYMMAHPHQRPEAVDMFSDEEKKQLLYDFNDTATVFPKDITIHQLFQEQVQKTPGNTAVIFEGNRLTYDQLNRKANRLAHRLRLEGVKPGAIVGILLMPSLERVVAMLAILKAGGAYLPIDPEFPLERITMMLEDCQAAVVISDSSTCGNYPLTILKSLYNVKAPIHMTGTRPQITDLDSLPLPDRSLVNYDAYMDKIGQAWLKHCIAIFATRGCPFKCAYCHKIWPKKHVVRSAENIFAEVKLYYQMGVRRFAIIDDIFNLNVKNSTRFFQLIIKNKLKVQLFFPNGLRGDLVDKAYLDLMVEAGTVGVGLALETASPRLQKLIKKNLNLKKFRENLEYLSTKYPQVISELYTMHGFPTETEEEALMTLDFIKSVKIIHFPYINILRIYSNTDMYKLAVENGISEKAIFNWENSYFHELPETLPFDKSFTLEVQTDFLEGYFLSKERLLKVLPYQKKIFTEEEFACKYSSYLLAEINSFSDLLQVTGISPEELGTAACLDETKVAAPHLDEKIKAYFPGKKPAENALRILFLDVSQFFSKDTDRLDVIFDPPLGMIMVMSHINQTFGDRVDGKIVKSRMDFDSFSELKTILEEFKPDIIGMRTLTYYRDLFHHTAALIRQWGFDVPVVAGGPYPTSNYNTILQDRNIDVVVLGEGEATFSELIDRVLENENRFPPEAVLKEIKGLAFVPRSQTAVEGFSREILRLDEISGRLETGPGQDLEPASGPCDPAYVMFTSGSTGKPKGVIVEHRSVVNNLLWFGETFRLDTNTNLLQLSDYTFDPSVEDIFGALTHGAVLYLSDKDLILDRERFRRFITDNHIHIIDHVPPMLDKLLGDGERLESLRVVITGGMRLEETIKDRLVKKGYPLYNNYGPTEVTVDALFTRCPAEGASVTLGKPIFNTRCYIFDRHNRLVPVGLPGELCIAGDGISRGYLNTPELTHEKFDHDLLDYLDYQDKKIKKNDQDLWDYQDKKIKKNDRDFWDYQDDRDEKQLAARTREGTGANENQHRRTCAAYRSPMPWGRRRRLKTVRRTQIPLTINNSQLTINNLSPPITPSPHYPIYRTGDLARWLPDGDIEFLGRIDRQIKIRGNRVELGEIEKQLQRHDSIKDVVVAAKGQDGDIDICAYVVPLSKGAVSGSQLKDYLALSLPDFMIPAFFVLLKALPLTPGGKIDISALPAPGNKPGSNLHYMEPGDKTEEKLVDIWSPILKLDREQISVTANFFDLGGHSLRATEAVYHIRKEFGVNIELKDFINQPTVRFWAQKIRELEPLTYMEVQATEKREYYDLSSAQRRLWIICQFEEDSTTYNMVGTFTITGDFSPPAFERAIQSLIDRHDNFRTIFIHVDGEAKQKIFSNFRFTLEQVDLRGTGPIERKQRTRELIKIAANTAFNLETGPLLLFKLLLLDENQYILIVNIHHIINDGWSLGVINNEIIALYNAYLNNSENPLPPLKLQYKDYTLWHNELSRKGHLDKYGEYWLEKFKDKPAGLELPLDHPRPPLQTFSGGRVYFTLEKENIMQLERIHKEVEATLFMKLFTLVTIFLYKYTGQTDIMIGAPIAGRNNPELHQMIGFLVNTLVYRIQVNPVEAFLQLLRNVKQETLAGYENQEYPFDVLVERLDLDRDLSRSPLFNVMLAFDNTDISDMELRMTGTNLVRNSRVDEFNTSVFDLVFIMDEHDGQVNGEIMYNSDLFDRSTIERMVENFKTLVSDVLECKDVPISQLNYIHERQYHTIVQTFNQTKAIFPPITLQEMFENQVEKTPGKIAVVDVDNKRTISYEDLNRSVNQLAHYLREEYQVNPGEIIGISMDRSLEMIVALLGIVKSGAGYVAIDTNYPEERALHMLTDSQCQRVIIDQKRPELFDNYSGQLIHIHRDWPQIAGKSVENPTIVNEPGDIIYVIYTSGSTGTPNGAMLSQALLSNLVQWQHNCTSIDSSARCLQFTTISFCVSFQEIFTTLTAGGELHLIDDIERRDINYLMNFLSQRSIEILYLPFSYLNHLFNESSRWGEDFKHSLKHIITAGEQLKITSGLKEFLDRHPQLQLHNHYGSSEMHVVTSYTLDAAAAAKYPVPPAGKPIANTKIFILDEHHQPVPIGVWGELCIAGSAEIAGYINNEALTENKLLNHPTLSDPGNRLYISGDIGRWLPDGNIELRGRKDTQIKIRGFRVELSEIESKLLAIHRVKDCVVEAKEKAGAGAGSTSSEQKYLVAYVVLDNIDIKEIKQIISDYLPHYMIPQFMILDALPLMPNGKVDRENLPEPAFEPETRHHIDAGKINTLLKEGKYKNANLQGISLQTADKTDLEKVLTCFTHHHADRQGIEELRVSAIDMDMLWEEDRKDLLTRLNGSTRYPLEKTLAQLFEEQVARTPDSTALEGTRGLAPLPEPEPISVTYNQLNRESNQLAHLLRSKGVKANRVVGLLLEPSTDMVTGIVGILKAGGAWFSIEPTDSTAAVLELLEQNNVSVLLTRVETLKSNHHVLTRLQDLESHQVELVRTSPRPQILDFDSLPIPDRSYIQHQRYGKHIGLAMVKHTLTLQGTRGCPYNCAFCHKIWPKRHVFRSAENIYKEVEIYYNMGFRRFVFVDDIFNLNVQNNRRFFELIIENRLDVQLMFPAGLRGDTLTKDYIDLMVKAGTINVALALETASSRLQKLIRKNLNLERFREIVDYICKAHPQVVLELFTMHGFPTETEEEALMTLNFVMDMKWIHFPYINILRIYANTDMEELALEHGISQEAIDRSAKLAYHELPETLPFDKGFTFEYQTRFLNEYFLDKDRLLHVLPYQMKVFTEDEIVQKYNSFLPTEITSFNGLLEFTGIKREELTVDTCLEEGLMAPVQVDKKISHYFAHREPDKDALRVLLLDLSQRFVREKTMLYDGVETPLGLMYVLTYLKQQLGPKVIGAAAKSRTDFASYDELKKLLDDFKPDLIGIRTLTYFADFFHEAVAMIRQWGMKIPIIAGGPYSTSDYTTILKDPNVDLVVMSEGEITFCELVEKIIYHQGKLPDRGTLKEIPGLVFRKKNNETGESGCKKLREVLLLDGLEATLSGNLIENPEHINQPVDLAHVFRTPVREMGEEAETVTVTHLNANLFLSNLSDRFSPPPVPGLPGKGPVVSYAFDASLQQVMGVLLQGGTCCIAPEEMRVPDIALLEFHQPLHIRLLQRSGSGAARDINKPQDEVEEKLAAIWADILEIEKPFIGRDDNFFDLGGHSLKATTLISKIHKAFEAKIKIIDVFRFPTIQELAQLIREETKEKFTAIETVEKKEYYKLSSAQKRLYIVQQMDENSTVYNMPAALELEGEPEKNRFESIFRYLIQRHESLRTSFPLVGKEPMQRIHNEVEFGIEYYDLQVIGAGDRCRWEDVFIKNFLRPFDLSQAPLLRVGIGKIREHQHILMVDMHHIIDDGTSTRILIEEFQSLYAGKEPPALAFQYRDYSQWQNRKKAKGELGKQEAYWLSQFSAEIPVPNLPTDYPRPVVQRFEGSTMGFGIGTEETRALKNCALEQGTTLYILLLAIYTIFLSKLSGQEHIIVGAPMAGRQHANLHQIIGMFVNTLPLTYYPVPAKTFRAFLKGVTHKTLEAFENQDYPYEELIERLTGNITRDTSRNPLFDVTFILQNVGGDINKAQIPGLVITPVEFPVYTSKFDLSLEAIENGETLSFTFEYSTRLYKEETIRRFAEYFKRILTGVSGNINVKLSDVDIISEKEKQRVLYEFNDTKVRYPDDKTIHQLFEEQVERIPDHTALIGQISNPKSQIPNPKQEGTRGLAPLHISCQELNEKSHQLAHLLKDKGVQPDTIVGIMVERSAEMIIGLLAILKAGAAYLPINPEYPEERLKYMLKDSKGNILVKKGNKFGDLLAREGIDAISIDDVSFYSSSPEAFKISPKGASSFGIWDLEFGISPRQGGQLAYIIYTSGSTGKPKGVLLQHRNVVRLVKEINYMDWQEGDKLLLTGSIVFDITTFEIWGPLLNGLALYLVHQDEIVDAEKLTEILFKNQISILHLIPQLFNRLAEQSIEMFAGLKYLLVGGDMVHPYYVNKVRNRYSNLKILHMYGPTENTTFSTFFPIESEYEVNIPIGKPISQSFVYIVDSYGKLQPIGVAGELWTGGDGVARGYLNNPELTKEKFCLRRPGGTLFEKTAPPGPPRKNLLLEGTRGLAPLLYAPLLYKTGDLARWLPDGNIEFLGRRDSQVKIRGFRVELGEIENRLLKHDRIKEVVVIVRETFPGDRQLCAYFVPHSPVNTDTSGSLPPGLISELKEYLGAELPVYMVPSYFLPLEQMPLTVSGKVDRKALPAPDRSGTGLETAYAEPETELEETIAAIWKRVLQLDKVGIHDHFFNVGGNSYNILQVNRELKQLNLKEISAAMMFKYTTISALARYLGGENTQDNSPASPREEKIYAAIDKSKSRLIQRKEKRKGRRK